MVSKKKIAVIVGSLRAESYNLKMARALVALAPQSLALEIVEIASLQLYNEELDANPPTSWVDFRKKVKEADGVIFLTPEYNRSFSGVIKNAIDVASRPWGQSVWSGKPAAIASVSVGALGGFGASQHLRQVLSFLNMPTLAQPEAYIANASAIFDNNGTLIDDNVRNFVKNFVDAYASWVETIQPGE